MNNKLTDKQKEMIKAQNKGYLASDEFNEILIKSVNNKKIPIDTS